MDAKQLYDEWQHGDGPGLRPHRVQAVRDDLEEYAGVEVPRRITEIEQWLEDVRDSGVVSKRLERAARSEIGNAGAGSDVYLEVGHTGSKTNTDADADADEADSE